MLRRILTTGSTPSRSAPLRDVDSLRRHVIAFVDRRRRWIIVTLLLLAGLSALDSCSTPTGPSTATVVASRDLEPGRPLTADDLTTIDTPSALTPTDVAIDATTLIGRVPAITIPSGAPVTNALLVGSGLRPRPGHVLVPVRLADAAVGQLLRAGDRVDLMAGAAAASVDTAPQDATVLSTDVLIAATPGSLSRSGGLIPASGGGGDSGGLVLVDVSERDAARLAGAASWARISVLLRPSAEERAPG